MCIEIHVGKANNNGFTPFIRIPQETDTIQAENIQDGIRALKIPDDQDFKIVIENEKDIKKIGENAFSGYIHLKVVTINGNIIKIGKEAFRGCAGLERIDSLENVLEIGDEAFSGCSNLCSIKIPDTVTTIGHFAFEDCICLSNVIITPETTRTIGHYVFEGCVSLSQNIVANKQLLFACNHELNYAVPQGVEIIKSKAFASYPNLYSIEIPSSVRIIENEAFFCCKNLQEIVFNNSNLEKIEKSAFRGCTALRRITIPNNVSVIGNSAFFACTSLQRVTFNENESKLKEIGSSAFRECTALRDISIPDSVRTIKKNAFRNCKELSSIKIPNTLSRIEDNTFQGCTSLQRVTFNENESKLEEIGSSAFRECTALRDISIPDSVRLIKKEAFLGCINLKTIAIQGVNTIEDKAFWGCANLIPALNNASFDDIGIAVPENVSIGNAVFSGCLFHQCVVLDHVLMFPSIPDADGKVCIPEGVTTIKSNAFDGCVQLKTIEIPDSVTKIEREAFKGCTSLKTITIPRGVRTIWDDAFKGCTSLREVIFNENVTSIKSGAFSGCTSLNSFVVPDSVTNIGNEAFSGCTGLNSFVISESVTRIGSEAFFGCAGLTEILIPNSVTELGERAFYNCTGLKSIVLSSNINTIKNGTFYGCTALQSVVIPDNVVLIEEDVFSDCTALQSIVTQNVNIKIELGAFDNCKALEFLPGNYPYVKYYKYRGRNECKIDRADSNAILDGLIEWIANSNNYNRWMNQKYMWPLRNNRAIIGASREPETVRKFSFYSSCIQLASDENALRKSIASILEWGGNSDNENELNDFCSAAIKLNNTENKNICFVLDQGIPPKNRFNSSRWEPNCGTKQSRVSFWTKVLAAYKPGYFFIYDSRVALALSFISIKSNSPCIWAIPQDAGDIQNEYFIQNLEDHKKICEVIQKNRDDFKVGQADIPLCYRLYLELLNKLSENQEIVLQYRNLDTRIRDSYSMLGFSEKQAIKAHMEKMLFMMKESIWTKTLQ